MEDLVTVIIPVYNVKEYLVKCLESVINQTYSNLQIILVDDGSTDGSGQLCDEFAKSDGRIQVIHQENSGQGRARNVGLDLCKGEYVTFLDSDDFWEYDFIEYLFKRIKINKADIAICNYYHVDERDICIKKPRIDKNAKIFSGICAMKNALYWKDFGVSPWAKIFHTKLWDNIRFKEDRIYEDLATTYLVYYKAHKVVYYNQCKMSYRIRHNSDVHQEFNEKKIRILDSADEILKFAKTECREALAAAESRKLATACFIYFRIPEDELNRYKDTVEICKNIVRKYRFGVMINKSARLKTRLGAALSYLGFGVERAIFKKFVN